MTSLSITWPGLPRQVITLEGWTELMDVLSDVSNDGLVTFYFVLVVEIGAFFLMNYLLAQVISLRGD